MRMTVSDVWCGTSRTSSGTTGRPPGRDHDAVGADLDVPVDGDLLGAGEPGVAVVEREVRAAVRAVVVAVDRDGVDAAEDAVADVAPAHLVQRRVDAEPARVPDVLGDVGRVDVHLRGHAADVDAGATEDAVLDHGDVEIGEAVVDDRVARAAPDDQEIVMPHAPTVARGNMHDGFCVDVGA
jgi:hypothetical protein